MIGTLSWPQGHMRQVDLGLLEASMCMRSSLFPSQAVHFSSIPRQERKRELVGTEQKL